MTLKILYTSTTNTGDFNCEIGIRGTNVGSDLTRAPGGAKLLPAPGTANELVEEALTFGGNTNIIDLNARILSTIFRRYGDSAEDTSSGDLRIVGIVLEYLEQ